MRYRPSKISTDFTVFRGADEVEVTLEAVYVPADDEGPAEIEALAAYRLVDGKYVPFELDPLDEAEALDAIRDELDREGMW